MTEENDMGIVGTVESSLNKIRDEVGIKNMSNLRIIISKEDYAELDRPRFYQFVIYRYYIYASSLISKGEIIIRGLNND